MSGSYGSDTLDASVLHIPLAGFLPFDNPRIISTVETVQLELCSAGLLYRYRTEDGLAGGEGAFLLCTFWLIDCLVAMGRVGGGRTIPRPHGDILEPSWGSSPRSMIRHKGEALGNFPQAFTHIGFLNSIIALRKAQVQKGAAEASCKEEAPLLSGGEGHPQQGSSTGEYQIRRNRP